MSDEGHSAMVNHSWRCGVMLQFRQALLLRMVVVEIVATQSAIALAGQVGASRIAMVMTSSQHNGFSD